MNRRVYEIEISAKYRLLKHLALKGVFEWRSTDRDYYEVESGETKTDEYIGRVGLSFRKAKLYGNINYGEDATYLADESGSAYIGMLTLTY